MVIKRVIHTVLYRFQMYFEDVSEKNTLLKLYFQKMERNCFFYITRCPFEQQDETTPGCINF